MAHEVKETVILDPLSMASCTQIKELGLSLFLDHPQPIMHTVWSRSETEGCPVVGMVTHDLMLQEGGLSDLLDHRSSTVLTLLGLDSINYYVDCINHEQGKIMTRSAGEVRGIPFTYLRSHVQYFLADTARMAERPEAISTGKRHITG